MPLTGPVRYLAFDPTDQRFYVTFTLSDRTHVQAPTPASLLADGAEWDGKVYTVDIKEEFGIDGKTRSLMVLGKKIRVLVEGAEEARFYYTRGIPVVMIRPRHAAVGTHYTVQEALTTGEYHHMEESLLPTPRKFRKATGFADFPWLAHCPRPPQHHRCLVARQVRSRSRSYSRPMKQQSEPTTNYCAFAGKRCRNFVFRDNLCYIHSPFGRGASQKK